MKEFIFSPKGLYYRINNLQPDRQTLVFIHGLIGSSSAWEKYEKKFEENYNILTFDLRGHGESKKFPKEQNYKVEEFAQDVYELVRYLKIEKFILISHSFGTIVGLEFLRHHSAMVNSAIFLNPIYHYRQEKFVHYYMMLIAVIFTLMGLFSFHPKNGKHIDYSRYKNTGDFDRGRLTADILNTTFRIYCYCLRQIYNYGHEDFWSELTMPVLILHGKKDRISSFKKAIAIHDLVKDSELVILENANHITVFNNFEEVSQAIEGFISKR